MFETFNTPALYLANKAPLALYNSLRISGAVVHVGSDAAYTVPVHGGYALPHATGCWTVGGENLTRFFGVMLLTNGVCSLSLHCELSFHQCRDPFSRSVYEYKMAF